MNRGDEVRQTLMLSTIRVVAAQGIQNATTKALSNESKLSEVYIYRFFNSKDDLFRETFNSLDKELMSLMLISFKKLNSDNNIRLGFKAIFHDFWKFTLSDQDKCSFFIQYYYSSYYLSHSETERKVIYQPLLDLMKPFFSEETDVWIELNHMYDVVFPKLLRVIRGTIPNDEKTEENIYRELALIEERNVLWNDVSRRSD